MTRYLTTAIILAVYSLSTMGALQAADTNSNEVRLREALRSALLQARTAETERATMEAEKADLKLKDDTLAKQVEALVKQSKSDKESSDKAIANLTTRSTSLAEEVEQLKEALAKSKDETQQARADAGSKEAARAKLASDVIIFQRIVADQKVKNAAMYKLGIEILRKYEKFGLGEALAAKEPFVGTMRVKFENLVQDYQDKLAEQKIKPQHPQ